MKRSCSALILLLPAVAAKAQGEGTDPSAVKTSLISQWDSAAEKISTARWKVTSEYYAASDGKTLVPTSTEIGVRAYKKNAGASWSWDYFGPNRQPTTRRPTAYLHNSLYIARLSHARDGGEWTLKELQRVRPSTSEQYGFLLPWTMLGNVPFHRLIKEPEFAITGVEALGPAGTASAIRLRFTAPKSAQSKRDFSIEGTVDVATNTAFRPVKFDYVYKTEVEDLSVGGELLYAPTPPGLDVPVLESMRIEQTARVDKRGTIVHVASREKHTISESEYNGAVPEDGFYLAGYGIPEPQGLEASKRPTPRYMQIGILGLGLLATGLIIRLLSSRHKAAGVGHATAASKTEEQN